MFKVLLRRKNALNPPSWVRSVSHRILPEAIEKITYITPERLIVLPCSTAPEVIACQKNIPFDLPAILWLLTKTTDATTILQKILENKTFSEKQPLFLFLPGSILNDELPLLQITSNSITEIEISSAPLNDPTVWKNAYQLRYIA